VKIKKTLAMRVLYCVQIELHYHQSFLNYFIQNNRIIEPK